jgi:hypothetical protein
MPDITGAAESSFLTNVALWLLVPPVLVMSIAIVIVVPLASAGVTVAVQVYDPLTVPAALVVQLSSVYLQLLGATEEVKFSVMVNEPGK